jgi:hypothetical protein
MKWPKILPVVAITSTVIGLAFLPTAAQAHHHHHCWGSYGSNYGSNYGSMNPWQMQRMMQGGMGSIGRGYSPYNMGYTGMSYGQNNGYGYGNRGSLMSGFGRMFRGL